VSQPWADVVLSGAVTTEPLNRHVKSIGLTREEVDWPVIAEPTGILGAAKRSRLAIIATAPANEPGVAMRCSPAIGRARPRNTALFVAATGVRYRFSGG
jgi:hypothetical protein